MTHEKKQLEQVETSKTGNKKSFFERINTPIVYDVGVDKAQLRAGREGTEVVPPPIEYTRMSRTQWYTEMGLEVLDKYINKRMPELTEYEAPQAELKIPKFWSAIRQPVGKLFEMVSREGYGLFGWKKFWYAGLITAATLPLPGFAFYTIPLVFPVVLTALLCNLKILDLDALVWGAAVPLRIAGMIGSMLLHPVRWVRNGR